VPPVDAIPPWYYFFYPGNLGSIIIGALILLGVAVLVVCRARKRNR